MQWRVFKTQKWVPWWSNFLKKDTQTHIIPDEGWWIWTPRTPRGRNLKLFLIIVKNPLKNVDILQGNLHHLVRDSNGWIQRGEIPPPLDTSLSLIFKQKLLNRGRIGGSLSAVLTEIKKYRKYNGAIFLKCIFSSNFYEIGYSNKS